MLLTALRNSGLLRLRLSDRTEEGLEVNVSKTGRVLVLRWTDELRHLIDRVRSLRRRIGRLFLFSSGKGLPYKVSGFGPIWQRAVNRSRISNLTFHDLCDWQRCVVHFYRNAFSHVPNTKVREVAAMLKAIHAQENREAAQSKAADVVAKLKAMKLKKAAELVENSIDDTLSFYAYPPQHWLKLKTNNPMERLLREARRRTKVVGAFPDGHSALMLVAARLRHVSATTWGTRKYMNIQPLEDMDKEAMHSAA